MEVNRSSETEYNLEKVCRSCLTEDGEMRSVFLNDGAVGRNNLNELMMACAQVQVIENDGMPSRICMQCITHVNHAFTYKQQCERSDATLRDYIMRRHPNIKLAPNLNIKQELYTNDDFHLPIKPEVTFVEQDPFENFYDDVNNMAGDSDSEEEEYRPNRRKKSIARSNTQKINKDKLSPYECDYCDKILVDAKGLTLHTRLHTGEKLKRCTVCNKGFNKSNHLTRHMTTHFQSDVKEPKEERDDSSSGGGGAERAGAYKCQFCEKSFVERKQLSEHIARHEVSPRKRGRPSKKEMLLRKQKAREQARLAAGSSSYKDDDDEEDDKKDILGPPKCSQCFKEFLTRDGLEIHMRKHTGEKLAVCRICDKYYTRTNHLRRHILTHSTPRTFKSVVLKTRPHLFEEPITEEESEETLMDRVIKSVCEGDIQKYIQITSKTGEEMKFLESESSETETELKEKKPKKLERKRKAKLHHCSICNAGFSRTNHIIRHMAVHNNEFPYKCDVCDKIFPNEDILNKHMKSQCNNTSKPFQCKTCNLKFMWEPSLIKHEAKHHGDDVRTPNSFKDEKREKSYICGVCNKAFYRQEHLDRHSKIHLPSEKKFECPTCQKKFNRKDNLRSHQRIHKMEKEDCDKHLCVYCGRSFSNSSNLIVHMRRHTGEKPYKCDICGKGFPRSSDLQCHRRTHTGEKPCLCTICGKGFSRSNKLVRHMRIHTGQRPYKCTFCERAFTQSNDLTLHIRRHTGDKPYVCGICGDRFIQGTALQAHRRMQGHYEELNQPTPFASASMNNPNPHNNPNRVNRINLSPPPQTPSQTSSPPTTSAPPTSSITRRTKHAVVDPLPITSASGLNLTSSASTVSSGVLVNHAQPPRVLPNFTGGYVPNGVPFLSNAGVLMQNIEVANGITNIPLFSISQYNQGYN